MRIRLELPRAKALPSQGRNRGSIPLGGAIASNAIGIDEVLRGDSGGAPIAGQFYRAWLDDDKPDGEFVFFVGWGVSNLTLIFQDTDGDVLICDLGEVEVC